MGEHISEFLRELVRERAHRRCEYCLILEFTQAATFHVDHCLPVERGGLTTAENLALACPHCDRQKWNHVDAMDLATKTTVPLFNPRQHIWSEHFKLTGYAVAGLTPIGRASVDSIRLNHLPKVRVRQIEESLGLFPPAFDSNGRPV